MPRKAQRPEKKAVRTTKRKPRAQTARAQTPAPKTAHSKITQSLGARQQNTAKWQNRWQGIVAWAQRVGLARYAAIALTVAAIVSGIATYITLTGSPPYGPDPDTVLVLLNLDLVLMLLLVALIARRAVRLWVARRKGLAGSRLHTRLVLLFSLVAVTPAILVAVFSALFFNFGIQAWFSERVNTALMGLELGADDYVVKPFSPRELVARIKSVLRRAATGPAQSMGGALRFGDCSINPKSRVVTKGEAEVQLTSKEFDLLFFLASNPSRVFTREQLMDQVWDFTFAGDLSTVTVHIRRLREKIEAEPVKPRYIKTVWGVGYKFES